MSNLNAQINIQQLNTDSKLTSQSTALPSPHALKQKYALSQIAQQHIAQHRQEIKNILNGHLKVSNDTFIYEGVEYIGAKFTISLKYEIKKEL